MWGDLKRRACQIFMCVMATLLLNHRNYFMGLHLILWGKFTLEEKVSFEHQPLEMNYPCPFGPGSKGSFRSVTGTRKKCHTTLQAGSRRMKWSWCRTPLLALWTVSVHDLVPGEMNKSSQSWPSTSGEQQHSLFWESPHAWLFLLLMKVRVRADIT